VRTHGQCVLIYYQTISFDKQRDTGDVSVAQFLYDSTSSQPFKGRHSPVLTKSFDVGIHFDNRYSDKLWWEQ